MKKEKKKTIIFTCLAPETIREKTLVKHHLGQPGLAKWLSQATRSGASQALEDLAELLSRVLGGLVLWEVLTVSGIE